MPVCGETITPVRNYACRWVHNPLCADRERILRCSALSSMERSLPSLTGNVFVIGEAHAAGIPACRCVLPAWVRRQRRTCWTVAMTSREHGCSPEADQIGTTVDSKCQQSMLRFANSRLTRKSRMPKARERTGIAAPVGGTGDEGGWYRWMVRWVAPCDLCISAAPCLRESK